jgi:hypothetical protein
VTNKTGLLNFKFIRIGDINLSIFSVLFLISGVILSFTDINIYQISGAYILLSSPDIYMKSSNKMIIIHYL